MSLLNVPVYDPDEYCEECNRDLCRNEVYRDDHGRGVCRECLEGNEDSERKAMLHDLNAKACLANYFKNERR